MLPEALPVEERKEGGGAQGGGQELADHLQLHVTG